jgi:glycosyltransferase involved in cell wall biosynthesis
VRRLLQESAGVLVTTDILRDRFLSFNSKIIVVPNALDERLIVRSMIGDQYNAFPSRRISIGYMGTRTHLGDLEMIAGALRTIADRFSEKVDFQVLGVAETEDLERVLDGISYRLIGPPTGEEEYPQFMLWYTSQVHWDIAIAPLVENDFNRCKSDIKLLDYAAIGAAGIYSDVEPYNQTVQHQQTGLLANAETVSWTNSLEKLITNANLRSTISKNCIKYLWQERTLAKLAHTWSDAIASLLG